MLTATGIQKSFPTRSGELVVLRDVSLSLQAGDSAAIMGPSGSGKSTLLNILGTLERPTAGSCRLNELDPFALDDNALARFRNEHIGFIFQDHHLLPQCSVLENVLIPTLADPRRKDASNRADRAKELIERVGLSDRVSHRPAELSGGERQRVAIARALIQKPTVVLADEPTGNLDRNTATRIVDLLLELQREGSHVLVVVTHSPTVAAAFDKRLELSDGVLEAR